MWTINELLYKLYNANGTDLHISVGTKIKIRVYGELRSLEEYKVITDNDAKMVAETLLDTLNLSILNTQGSVDISYQCHAKDKDLLLADIVSCFMSFDREYDLERFDYNTDETKNYNELTDEQKIKLISMAREYYIKDDNHTDVGCICDCVMAHQIEILNDSLSRHEFYMILFNTYN